MEKLNLPPFDFKIKKSAEGKADIFDEMRKKYVALTPEEWVRQNFIRYLTDYLGYPGSLIAIEKGLVVNNRPKRFDAVVHDKFGAPLVLLEFKAPSVKLTTKTFEQIALYNQKLKVKYLIISNGLKHYCCKIAFDTQKIEFLKEIPSFENLKE